MTTPSSLQQLKELGEGLGFTGAELVDFIKEKQALERADRQAKRDAKEKEKERIDRQAEREAREKEKEREHREKEAGEKEKERQEEEAKRQAEAAEKERQRQFELEKADRERQYLAEVEAQKRQREQKLAAETEKERQFELRKKDEEREFERLKIAAEKEQREYEEAKLARERNQAKELQELRHAHEMEKMHTEFRMTEEAKITPSKDHRNADSGHSGTGFIKAPKMPYFDEDKDFMDSYLNRFEQFATSQRWKPSTWALCLSALLRGRALDVYSMMAKDDVNDYEKLKSALLKRYQLTADGFRKRFRTSRPEAGESPSQFITWIGNYLQRWIDMAKAADIRWSEEALH